MPLYNQASGGGGGISPPAGDIGGSTGTPTVVATHLSAGLPVNQGGTGQNTTAAAAYNALSPMSTTGDLEYESGANTASRLAVGSTGQILSVVSGLPAWQSLDGTSGDIAASPGTAAAGAVGKAADAGHVHPQPTNFAPAGLTGATSASRYAGATTSGSPASGTFAVGDFVVDRTGTMWICTTAGTVGSGCVFNQVGTASRVMYKQTSSAFTPNATLGTYGSAVTLTPDAGYTAIIPVGAYFTTTSVSSETVTMQVTPTYNTGAGTAQTTTATTNTNAQEGNSLLFAGLYSNGAWLTSLSLQVKSTINSSTASVTFTVYGTNTN